MVSRSFILACGLVAAFASTAGATPFVSVEARWNDTGDADVDVTNSSGPIASATAVDSADGGGTTISTDPLPSCGLPATCAVLVPPGGVAIARAEANGQIGALRARTVFNGNPTQDFQSVSGDAEAIARLTDTLVFSQPTGMINVDLDFSSHLGGPGSTAIGFSIVVEPLSDPCDFDPSPDCVSPGPQYLALFTASKDIFEEGGSAQDFFFYSSAFPLEFDQLPLIDSGDSFPDDFQFSVDLSSYLGLLQQFGLPLELELTFQLGAEATSLFGDSATVIADQSAFIEVVGGTSESGYSYRGRPLTEPDPVDAPAPGGLMFAGLAALALARLRRTSVRESHARLAPADLA